MNIINLAKSSLFFLIDGKDHTAMPASDTKLAVMLDEADDLL